MVNLLGDVWGESQPRWNRLLERPNVMLHLYGKKSARPGRKMGHFNVLSSSAETALKEARSLHAELTPD